MEGRPHLHRPRIPGSGRNGIWAARWLPWEPHLRATRALAAAQTWAGADAGRSWCRARARARRGRRLCTAPSEWRDADLGGCSAGLIHYPLGPAGDWVKLAVVSWLLGSEFHKMQFRGFERRLGVSLAVTCSETRMRMCPVEPASTFPRKPPRGRASSPLFPGRWR